MLSSSAPVRVRSAKLADAKPLSEVFRASWLHAYRGILPTTFLETTIRRRAPEWWRASMRSNEGLLVAEVDDRIAGYAKSGRSRTQGPQEGEIYEIYLLPEFQGLGFGEHLFEACRYRLDHARLNGLVVWALAANAPALNFYWRRGGRPIGNTFERVGGRRLEKIAMAWD